MCGVGVKVCTWCSNVGLKVGVMGGCLWVWVCSGCGLGGGSVVMKT